MQFVAQNQVGCSITPPADYANNGIYQELQTIDKYSTQSDEEIYLDLRASKGYTDESGKLKRDNNDLVLKIT